MIQSVYISEAEKYDKALIDSWRGNMNGMLIFAGLFSSVLSSFIVESYSTLQPQPPTGSVAVLALCIHQILATNATHIIPNSPCQNLITSTSPSQSVSHAALVCNILWFISLGLSLASALLATLVEQWAREFLQRTEMLPSPVKRARIFAFLYYGLQRFSMHQVVGVVPLLLHLSLLFFFGGLVAFLYPVSKTVAYAAAVPVLIAIVVLYGGMTVFPLIELDCPYKTPLSEILWTLRRYFLRLSSKHEPLSSKNELESGSLHRRFMVHAIIDSATIRSVPREDRDKRALAWTMKSLADDDDRAICRRNSLCHLGP
ncbi:hypothetical protein K438DRAFT_1613892 [Mycena galopus ATCC 62051]|nr:hypothetical protein K438DRAFT_1613892 [Mycena galopus ATCC 62051]